MSIKQLLSIGLLTCFGLSAIASVASAEVVSGKETRTGDIYVSGLSSYQSLTAAYSSLPKVLKKTANECGFFKLSNSISTPLLTTSNIKLGTGTAALVSSFPVEASPKCTNGVLSGTNLTPSAVLRTAEGDVYFTGLTDFAQYVVSYLDLAQTRSIKSNSCGIAKLSGTGDYASPTGTIAVKDKETLAAVETITLASVPSVSGGPVCRNGSAFYTNDWPTN